jgi:hypothetical protein
VSGGYVVVLLTGDKCEKYPGQTCVMDVLGPFTMTTAERVFARQPDWACPHIIVLSSQQEPGQPDDLAV